MATAKKDFEGFVRWLHLPENETPSGVHRMANLILANFDEVLETSRQHSNRSVLIANLAQHHLSQTPDILPELTVVPVNDAWSWKRLRHLTVGPFRGFRYAEPFDLQKRIVLFYGPNGSGKTSLCEALEYSLIGSVDEAEVKRIDAATYLSNIHEGNHTLPILTATDHQGNEMNVEANSDAYRFCFIEKNRIDSFSRIAARPATQRTELIATLFGMEKFNHFVRHFNESMDTQLNLSRINSMVLEQRRDALEQDQALVSGEAQGLQTLDREELELALKYSENTTYKALKDLIGSVEAPSRLLMRNYMTMNFPTKTMHLLLKNDAAM